MCIVFVSLETHSIDESALKVMHAILAFSAPRLNSQSCLPVPVSKTRIKVPLSEAVANRVPVLFSARYPIVVE